MHTGRDVRAVEDESVAVDLDVEWHLQWRSGDTGFNFSNHLPVFRSQMQYYGNITIGNPPQTSAQHMINLLSYQTLCVLLTEASV